jgi:SRSO17 transposase
MTEQEIRDLGPAFATYLGGFRDCFLQKRTAAHFDTYGRGLLSDLPRKSVEPVALAAGTAVRTLQEFLTTSAWDHGRARDLVQRRVADALAGMAADPVGTVGVIDETSCLKKGDQTPGVQRQYLGCAGKIDNGIVTVHVAVARGRFKALLDADLYLPQEWDADRVRCRAAGVPDDVRYRPKWKLALGQLARLAANGVRFGWLTFDEGYGAAVPMLRVLNLAGQRFVAEVPKSFAVRPSAAGAAGRADERLPAVETGRWKRFRLARQTGPAQVGRATAGRVWAAGRWHRLVAAVNEATGEVKYFLTNAVTGSLKRVLAVAFCRWHVEHVFRVAKSEAGLMHYEGRDYTGLIRHLTLGLVVLGFVALHTERLRGEKPGPDIGAGVPGVERPVCSPVPAAAGDGDDPAHERGHPVSPAAERGGHEGAQETAA